MNKIDALYNLIKNSDNIVFFGGAGVSVSSGIPDFRSADGLYNEKYQKIFSPEEILSHTFFKKAPDKFYEFYKGKMIYKNALDNNCHKLLAYLEKIGKLKAIITQNIDGLHQKAGSINVLELHGSVHRNFCVNCLKDYDLDYVINSNGVPLCSCGGIIKPDVVLYEESLNDEVLFKSINYIRKAELLIVGGTSLSVYPAAGLIRYYDKDKLVIVNKSITSYDKYANLVINDDIDNVFKEILDRLIGDNNGK